MIRNPYFSVIVCLYNSVRFFSQGIGHIIAQSFRDFELILVDDGSNDSTPALCDKIAESYPNIKVVHQENRGLGEARNRGIDTANGKYLCFFDIDDIIGDDWLENIYDEIKEVNPDLLVYGYKEIDVKFQSKNSFRFERVFLTDKSRFVKGYTEFLSGIRFNNGFAWNKVYKKDFIDTHRIRFTDETIQQDEIFNHRVYQYFPKTLISDKILYNYHIYDKGNNRKRYIPQRIRNFENVKKSFIEIKNKFEIRDKRLDEYIHRRFLRNVLFNRNPLNTFKDRKAFYASIIDNNQAVDSAGYLKKDKSGIKNIHDIFFNIYCFGIRNKSLFTLLITEYLYSGVNSVYRTIFK